MRDKKSRKLRPTKQLSKIKMYFSFFAGVIIFGSDQEVAGLMRAVKRMGATGKFSWIGSDGWSARALVSDGKEVILF